MEVTVALMQPKHIPLFKYSHLEAQSKPLRARAKEELAKQGITEQRWVHLLIVMTDNGREIAFPDLDKIPFEEFPVTASLRGVLARVEPETLVGDFKEDVSALLLSYPVPSRITLVHQMKILPDDAHMKDYNITDGSMILVVQKAHSKTTDGSRTETANAQTLSLPLTASYDPVIEMLTSKGFPREFVVKLVRENFGNVDGTAEYVVPDEVQVVQLPREDGLLDLQVPVAKPEVAIPTGREIKEAQMKLWPSSSFFPRRNIPGNVYTRSIPKKKEADEVVVEEEEEQFDDIVWSGRAAGEENDDLYS